MSRCDPVVYRLLSSFRCIFLSYLFVSKFGTKLSPFRRAAMSASGIDIGRSARQRVTRAVTTSNICDADLVNYPQSRIGTLSSTTK